MTATSLRLSVLVLCFIGVVASVAEVVDDIIQGSYIVSIRGNIKSQRVKVFDKVKPRGKVVHGKVATYAQLTQDEVEVLKKENGLVVENDRTILASCIQFNPPWGLSRIDQRSLPYFTYSAVV